MSCCSSPGSLQCSIWPAAGTRRMPTTIWASKSTSALVAKRREGGQGCEKEVRRRIENAFSISISDKVRIFLQDTRSAQPAQQPHHHDVTGAEFIVEPVGIAKAAGTRSSSID